MFNHVGVKLQPITATNKDGVRLYATPEGNKYPSITTVLSVRNKKGLMEWRKRVGNDVANHVARTAASRGTKVHHMCEDYLNNMQSNFPKEWEKHKKNFLPHALFTQMRDNLLHRIDNIYSQECGLYSDKYRVAGRVDCIAEFDGKLSVIDFKTSRRVKYHSQISNYFAQCAAYAIMYEEMTGIAINRTVVLIAVDGDSPQIFIEKRDNYVPHLLETKRMFDNGESD